MTIFARLMKAIQYIVKKADMVLLGLCLVCTAFGRWRGDGGGGLLCPVQH